MKWRAKDPAAQAEFFMHLEAYWEFSANAFPENDLVETTDERKGQIKQAATKGVHLVKDTRTEAEIEAEADAVDQPAA
jgi:hypothetical protein